MRLSFKSLVIGLGIGIILTSLFLMGITLKLKDSKETTFLTNDQIVEKAKELGMIDPLNLESEKFVLSNEEIINKAKKLGMEFSSSVDLEVYKSRSDHVEFVTIFIPKGISANKMGRIFYENNLIDNIEGFDTYLKNKKLSIMPKGGYFDIPKNSNYEELINILTK